MATASRVQQPDPMAQVQALLTTLGGTTETRTPGDISALQTVFANTQAFDPAALLQSIFQQAAGQIPGLANAYGNAIGARRTNNSGIQNALNALLAQTAIEGQKQVVQQQQQNMQTQANVAGNIAQATAGTSKKTSTDMGSAAKNLLILQGLAKLADTDIGKQVMGKNGLLGSVLGVSDNTQAAPAPTTTPAMAPAPVQASQAPQQTFNIVDLLQSSPAQALPADFGMSMAPDMETFNIMDYLSPDTVAPEMSYAPAEWFQQPDVMSYFGE